MANVLTSDILKKITGRNVNYDEYVKFLNIYMPEYEINTLPRIQFFIAIACGESGGFTQLTENLYYTSVDRIKKVFDKDGTRFKNEDVEQYVKEPKKLANRVYGNLHGNNQPDDGWNYRGSGVFQLTFKGNYSAFQASSGIQVVANPELLREVDGGVKSACHYAKNRKILVEADKNTAESFIEACKKVGKCANGDNYAKKREYWARCKAFIGGNGVVEGVDEVVRENTNLTFLTSTDLNVFLNAQQNKP